MPIKDRGDFVTSMKKLAKPRTRKRDINPDACIRNIEWAASNIKDELIYGGMYVVDRAGRPVLDEKGNRQFQRTPDLNKVKGFQVYADIQFRLLKKVMPDAVPAQLNNNNAAESSASLLEKLVEHLPD